MRSNLLAIPSRQILYYLTETGIIYIHFCHIYHSREIILVAQFPRFLGSYLDARLAGHHNNCCIRGADSLLYFTDKVKISRRIKDIDLCFLPLNRDQACADRKTTFLFLFIKVTHRAGI